MSDWADMSEVERVAKAIRDAEWAYFASVGQDYVDTLPLTRMNLAAAKAAIEALDAVRAGDRR